MHDTSQTPPIVIGVLIIAAGLFTIFCAARDYEWFMTHRKAELLRRILGRTGTRILYITLGVALLVVGIVLLVAQPR